MRRSGWERRLGGGEREEERGGQRRAVVVHLSVAFDRESDGGWCRPRDSVGEDDREKERGARARRWAGVVKGL